MLVCKCIGARVDHGARELLAHAVYKLFGEVGLEPKHIFVMLEAGLGHEL